MFSQSHNISMADSSLQKWGVMVISGKKGMFTSAKPYNFILKLLGGNTLALLFEVEQW